MIENVLHQRINLMIFTRSSKVLIVLLTIFTICSGVSFNTNAGIRIQLIDTSSPIQAGVGTTLVNIWAKEGYL